MTFLPVFSKCVLSRIRNIFPIQKSKQCFEYLHKHSIMVTYFRKVKQTWTRIRKKNLEWKQLKRLGFSSDSICRLEVYLPSTFRTCAVETVKSCILVFCLLHLRRFTGTIVLCSCLLPFTRVQNNSVSKKHYGVNILPVRC